MDASKMAISKPNDRNYPVEYSLVEIVYVDGTTTSFMLKAGLGIAKYLQDDLKEQQALMLRNDTDVMVITREQLRSFTLRAMTQENN